MLLSAGIGRRAAIAPGPGSGTLSTVELSAPTTSERRYDDLEQRARAELVLERDGPVLRVLGLEVVVHRVAADRAVGVAPAASSRSDTCGCTASAAALTVFAKKNGSVCASACCTL